MKKTIQYFVTGMITAAVLTFSACKDDETLPPIDGFNNSNEVASTNLVAHWTFDDTNNERLSSTAPTKTVGTVGFTTGKVGKALQLTKGGIVYPAIAKINTVNALNNFTISMWVDIRGQKGVVGGGYTSLFGIIPTATDFWGNIQATVETGRHLPGSDTVEFKNYLNTTMPDNSQRGEDNVALFNKDAATTDGNGQTGAYFKGGKEWALYTMSWEGSTGLFKLYANGVSVGGYTKRGVTAGVLKMRVPALAVFGSMASSDLGFASATRPDWAPLATASIDDVRVFNTALSQAEVTALYNLGVAGR